jgi:hypothetical protein
MLLRDIPDNCHHLTTLSSNRLTNSVVVESSARCQGTGSFMYSGNSQSSSGCIRSQEMPAARISSSASWRSGSVTTSVPNSPWLSLY